MSGEKTAVQLAVEERPLTDDPDEQLDLLGLPDNVTVLTLREKTGKPGRPLGARNKRTQEWADYLLSKYPSPLEVLAQIYVARVDVLAASLGCTKLEAMQEKRLAAAALIPYVHQKQPLAVNLNAKSVVYLTINEGDGSGPQELSLTALVVEKIDDGSDPQS